MGGGNGLVTRGPCYCNEEKTCGVCDCKEVKPNDDVTPPAAPRDRAEAIRQLGQFKVSIARGYTHRRSMGKAQAIKQAMNLIETARLLNEKYLKQKNTILARLEAARDIYELRLPSEEVELMYNISAAPRTPAPARGALTTCRLRSAMSSSSVSRRPVLGPDFFKPPADKKD